MIGSLVRTLRETLDVPKGSIGLVMEHKVHGLFPDITGHWTVAFCIKNAGSDVTLRRYYDYHLEVINEGR